MNPIDEIVGPFGRSIDSAIHADADLSEQDDDATNADDDRQFGQRRNITKWGGRAHEEIGAAHGDQDERKRHGTLRFHFAIFSDGLHQRRKACPLVPESEFFGVQNLREDFG